MKSGERAIRRTQSTSPSSTKFRPELGLVCLTHSEAVRFRTTTLSRYRSLMADEQRTLLTAIYDHNVQMTVAALGFCRLHDIRLYRMSSSLFPMSDTPLGESLLREREADLSLVRRLADLWHIRVVMHPDQFAVLNSVRPQVIEQTREILSKHALAMDLMGLSRSPWSAMILHGGVGGRGEELIRQIGRLEPAVRSRLVLENDERSYGAADILSICQSASVPMVFDAHHQVVKERLPTYDDPSIAAFTVAAAHTWPKPSWQLVHISNGRAGLHDVRHSTTIQHMPKAFADVPWIEIEAKGKEMAIEDLRNRWRPARRAHRLSADPVM